MLEAPVVEGFNLVLVQHDLQAFAAREIAHIPNPVTFPG
jgi:hypothetical protein